MGNPSNRDPGEVDRTVLVSISWRTDFLFLKDIIETQLIVKFQLILFRYG